MCLGLFALAKGVGSGEWKVVRFSHFQNHDFVGHYLLNSYIGISCMVADSRSLVASQNMEEYCTEVKAIEAKNLKINILESTTSYQCFVLVFNQLF